MSLGTVDATTPPADPPKRRRLWIPFVALVVALGYPLVRQVVLSFQEFGLAQQFGQPAEWVGLENYRELVADPYLWTVVVRSLLFCLANAAITMCIGVAVALLISAVGSGGNVIV